MHRDEIPIASPCSVDFSSMTLADAKKRFCGECKKHVHDLSQMSRTEARALLSSPTTEGLCVHYLYDERGAVWFAEEAKLVAPSRLARMKRFVAAAAAVAAPLSLTACMGAAMPHEPLPPPPSPPAAPAPSASAAPTTSASAAPAAPQAPASAAPAPKVAAPR
ncbi:Hypothetical protein A7982_10370 [Minicystis rosea]|nr:Hypothetical protein A7982_10370 [Minicystis rosea]